MSLALNSPWLPLSSKDSKGAKSVPATRLMSPGVYNDGPKNCAQVSDPDGVGEADNDTEMRMSATTIETVSIKDLTQDSTDDDDDDDECGSNETVNVGDEVSDTSTTSGYSVGTTPLASPSSAKAWVDGGIGLLSAEMLAAAIDFHYSTPLPDVSTMFPWLHGVHPDNLFQQAFLDPNKRFREAWLTSSRAQGGVNDAELPMDLAVDHNAYKVPRGARGLLLIKVGDQKGYKGTVVGSVRPDEVLAKATTDSNSDSHREAVAVGTKLKDKQLAGRFLCLDPEEGISLRNFSLQTTKWAVLSDIVVYAADFETDRESALQVARKCAEAQRLFASENDLDTSDLTHTYLLDDSLDILYKEAPQVMSKIPLKFSVDADEQRMRDWDTDFRFHERIEMAMMSSASPIGDQACVWIGNTANYHSARLKMGDGRLSTTASPPEALWRTFVECNDRSIATSSNALLSHIQTTQECLDKGSSARPIFLCFPGMAEKDFNLETLVLMCKLLEMRSKLVVSDTIIGSMRSSGSSSSSSSSKDLASVLLFCQDGYTETSMLGLAYLMYTQRISAAQACVDMHLKYNRQFFTTGAEINVLRCLETELAITPDDSDEVWFSKTDGSFPSRILPHMYLGSLVHADNPHMLARLGIKRVLSIGEHVQWINYEANGLVVTNPGDGVLAKAMYVGNVQDDGVDPLTGVLARCLDFLDQGLRRNEPTLVHCRVGVSRSATVCIAEVMERLSVGLARAYLFVRVRRLNVIIQPNLRFMYELVKWEEQHRRAGEGWLREVDWHMLCRGVSSLNRGFASS